MKHMLRLSLTILGCSFIIHSPTIAQEVADDIPLRDRIDSVIQSIFHRFDEQFGTSIFSDEPAERPTMAAQDPSDQPETESSAEHTIRKGRRYTRHPSSLYAFRNHQAIVRNWTTQFPWENLPEDIIFRYNRVEGLFLGLSHPQRYDWNNRRVSIFGSGGYGFANHRWQYELGMAQNFGIGGTTILGVGLEGHNFMDTRDHWIITSTENTLTALLARDDYRNYYLREGFSIWTGLYQRWTRSDMQMQLAYMNDRYASIQKRTDWSFFGGEKTFRENPSVDDGRMKSLIASFNIHAVRERYPFVMGWSTSASAEFAGRGLGGEFDFDQYLLDIRRYQPISKYDHLNVRVRVGSSSGDLPAQKVFELGGLGTLPAFQLKEFSGNRLLLANFEYLVSGKLLGHAGFIPALLRHCTFILFADAGYVSSAHPTESITSGFDGFKFESLRSDWGFGIGTREAKVRLGFAWRTDVAEPVHIFLRLDRPF